MYSRAEPVTLTHPKGAEEPRMRFGHISAGAILALLVSACATEQIYKISDITDARALSDHAVDLLVEGDHAGAIKALDAVIAYGSVDDRDFARRAAVYGTQKNYDKALADANRAIELASKAWRRFLERAILYQRIGDYGAAIGDLDSAVAIQPNEVELLRRRAYLKVVAARFDDAVTDYENISRILPRSDTGALGRGAALYLADRWSEAAAQFADMLRARPEDGLAALWLAKARMRSGQFLAWEDVERGAGPEPEWLMARALLTVDADTRVIGLLSGVEACERAVFFGLWRIVHQSGNGAEKDFHTAGEVCPIDSIEASEARVELARLKTGAGPPPIGER